jgi:hypothetical protein
MRKVLFLATFLFSLGTAFAQAPTSQSGQAAAAPVVQAIETALQADAALPAPTSTREKLERMGRLDQAGRRRIPEVERANLTPDERTEARRAVAAALKPVDEANYEALKSLIPSEGWFTLEEHGPEAVDAALHILQHSGDLETMELMLPRLKVAAERGDVAPYAFAALFDRVSLMQGKPQRYGTQYHCVEGKLQFQALEDSASVERLRAEINVPRTFAEDQIRVGQVCV